jgi:peroxiredoxin
VQSAFVLALIAVSAVGCAPAETPSASAAKAVVEEEASSEPFRVVSPTEPVPKFRVVATNGSVFDSEALIGKEPFVVAFYATWCKVCEFKLPDLLDVLHESGKIAAIGVAVDDEDTWKNVDRYAARHRLPFPTVRGGSFPRFALAYDPFQTVPVVAVVGRNGYLVDYQIGYSSTHRERLIAAVELASRMSPDSPPVYEQIANPEAPREPAGPAED